MKNINSAKIAVFSSPDDSPDDFPDDSSENHLLHDSTTLKDSSTENNAFDAIEVYDDDASNDDLDSEDDDDLSDEAEDDPDDILELKKILEAASRDVTEKDVLKTGKLLISCISFFI